MSDAYQAVPDLSLVGARAIVDAALARAHELRVNVVIAVTDRAGRLLAFARMDNAFVLSIDVAQKKAKSVCAAGGATTGTLWDTFKADPELLYGLAPKLPELVPVKGGLPVVINGVLAGAIGVSGASAEQDEDIASAGAAAVS